jgi:hypothetical protein
MNTNTIWVFLGPSLPLAQAQARCPSARFLPPVAAGDLHRLALRQARAGDVVAVIDGVFEQVGAVWHKEILFAIERGLTVVGASSMGALRAAELDRFGMLGHGQVYEAYASGELVDDDEVAVAHASGEQGFRSLSMAMVAIRQRLAALVRAGRLSDEQAQALAAASKTKPYAERSWAQLRADARALGLDAAPLAALHEAQARPDAKAADAASLLALLARGELPPPRVPREAFSLEPTVFWRALEQHERLRGSGETTARDDDGEHALARQVRALHPDRERLLARARLLTLAALWGEPATAAARREAATRIAQEQGLTSALALARWRTEQGLDDRRWQRLVELEARAEALLAPAAELLDECLLLELRRQGRHAQARERVQRQRSALAERGIPRPTLADAGLDADTLAGWYEPRLGPLPTRPDVAARALGFGTLREWIDELAAAAFAESAAGIGNPDTPPPSHRTAGVDS